MYYSWQINFLYVYIDVKNSKFFVFYRCLYENSRVIVTKIIKIDKCECNKHSKI